MPDLSSHLSLFTGKSGLTFDPTPSFERRIIFFTSHVGLITDVPNLDSTVTVVQTRTSCCIPIRDESATAPAAPVLVAQLGKDQLQIQWDRASSGLPQCTIFFEFTVGDSIGVNIFEVDWGDGSPTEIVNGFAATSVVDTLQHTYFISTPTISVTVTDALGVEEIINLPQTLTLGTNWCVSQFQIERFKSRQNYSLYQKRLVADWRSFAPGRQQTDFIDYKVDRRFTWGYRIRFREVSDDSLVLGTGPWSSFSVQDPWA